MAGQDEQVVRVDQPASTAPFEDVLRVRRDVLVERVDDATSTASARLLAAARAAELLPEARERCPGSPSTHAASSPPMSMPSSSAFVATTPRTRPSRRPRSIRAARRQVAAAVAARRARRRRACCAAPRAGSVSSTSTRVRLGAKTIVCTPARMQLARRCRASRSRRLRGCRARGSRPAGCEDDHAFARRRAVVVDELDVVADERRRRARPGWRSSPSSR